MKSMPSILMMTVYLSFSPPQACQGNPLSEAGKWILEEHRPAVVTVRMVIKEDMSFGGYSSHEYESQSEAIGTVLDASGLTVLSLSETDPSSLFADLLTDNGEEDGGFEMKSKITDVQLVLEDGREIPARIVLRDKDLDLAFARPIEPVKEPMKHLDLSESDHPEILDEVLILSRMGRKADRAPRLSVSRVEAVVNKPRTFYVLSDQSFSEGLGCPVFSVENRHAVGIILYRSTGSGSGMGLSALTSSESDDFDVLAVVIPAQDIREVATHAPQVGSEPVESN